MLYADLFDWWIATITWSIAFPIAVSLYLYRRRPSKQPKTPGRKLGLERDFSFVWFLAGLLVFYIVTVSQGSAFLFAVGNIVVEALLLLYVAISGKEQSQPTTR